MIIKRKHTHTKNFSLAPTRALAKFNMSVRKMPKYSAMRSALMTEKKGFDTAAKLGVGKVVNGAQKLKKVANKLAMNPGKPVREMVKSAIKQPVTGTATALVPGGSLIQATPLPKAEGKLLDKVGVGKYTRRAANYVDRHVGPYIESGVNTILTPRVI